MVGLGFGKQGGSKTKGGIPLFFFAPPLAGGCEKKSGVRKERGVHAPRAPPPEYAPVQSSLFSGLKHICIIFKIIERYSKMYNLQSLAYSGGVRGVRAPPFPFAPHFFFRTPPRGGVRKK